MFEPVGESRGRADPRRARRRYNKGHRMTSIDAVAAETCDSLYVSPGPGDVALSCAARIVRERAAGQRVLVVSLFAGAGRRRRGGRAHGRAARAGRASRPRSTCPTRARAPPARRPATPSCAGAGRATTRRCTAPPTCSPTSATARARARSTRRWVWAATPTTASRTRRRARPSAAGDGRDVFFYEERPESLMPGAVRVRLAPDRCAPAARGGRRRRPGAAAAVPPALPRGTRVSAARSRAAATACARFRLAARFWRDGTELAAPARARAAAAAGRLGAGDQGDALAGRPPAHDARTDALAAAYGRRLRAGAHAERYWLLLPPLAGDGWEDLGPALAGAGAPSPERAGQSAIDAALQRAPAVRVLQPERVQVHLDLLARERGRQRAHARPRLRPRRTRTVVRLLLEQAVLVWKSGGVQEGGQQLAPLAEVQRDQQRRRPPSPRRRAPTPARAPAPPAAIDRATCGRRWRALTSTASADAERLLRRLREEDGGRPRGARPW